MSIQILSIFIRVICSYTFFDESYDFSHEKCPSWVMGWILNLFQCLPFVAYRNLYISIVRAPQTITAQKTRFVSQLM